MANTYEKLGQYSSTELPNAPTEVQVTLVENERIVFQWVNNTLGAEYPTAQNIIQQWMGTFWETKTIVVISATTGAVIGLSEGTNYRFRVAVLCCDVIYPAVPITQTTTAVPKPTDLYITASGTTTIDIAWTNADTSTWDGIKVKLDGNTVATLPVSATTYQYTGLTAGVEYSLVAASVIAGVDYDSVPLVVTIPINCMPVDFRITQISGNQVWFEWTCDCNFEDCNNCAGDWTLLANGVGKGFWDNTCLGGMDTNQLQQETDYTFVIKRNYNGEDTYSNSVTGRTGIVDCAPTNLEAHDTSNTHIAFHWDRHCSGCGCEQGEGENQIWVDGNINDTINGMENEYTIEGLQSSTTYQVQVIYVKDSDEYPSDITGLSTN